MSSVASSRARGADLIHVLLRLGRVSNLPTVWSNVLAGVMVVSCVFERPISLAHSAWLMLVLSLFYCGGMVLNDAFDREIDARERPGRPIPSGQISVQAVFAIGFGLEALGIALLSRYGMAAMLTGTALACTILLYNVWHKGNTFSPLIMGVCRTLVYWVAAASTMAYLAGFFVLPLALLIAGCAMWAHVVGLTYAAKQESLNRLGSVWPLAVLAMPLLLVPLIPLLSAGRFWPMPPMTLALAALAALALLVANIVAVRILLARATPTAVPRAVAQLIAAIALLDGLVIAVLGGSWQAVLFCWCAWLATRIFQRIIPGT